MTGDFWTPSKDRLLREWTAAGKRAAEMADELGCTRNAVLGRRFRLGIVSPPRPAPPRRAPRVPAPRKPPVSRGRRGHNWRAMVDARTIPEATVLETFVLVHVGLSRYKAAALMGVSHQNLRPRLWPSKYAHLWEAAKPIAAERKAQMLAWQEAGNALARQRRDAQMRAVAECNARVLHGFPYRIQEVVHRRIAGESLAEIAADLGVTRERVRQLQAWAAARGAVIPGFSISPAMLRRYAPKPPRIRNERKNRTDGWTPEKRAAASARMREAWAYVKRQELK